MRKAVSTKTKAKSKAKTATSKTKGKAFNVGHIPTPWKDPSITLADIPGAKSGAGALVFHAVGDTGQMSGREEEEIALAMAKDYDADPAPQFFLHLGDVMYGDNKDTKYIDEFYRPYGGYPGPIVAVPGNHDGEIKAKTDPVSLAAFWSNF